MNDQEMRDFLARKEHPRILQLKAIRESTGFNDDQRILAGAKIHLEGLTELTTHLVMWSNFLLESATEAAKSAKQGVYAQCVLLLLILWRVW